MAISWTDKQKRFVEEYCVDFNATQAAIRAGYSEKTAGSMGSENLQKPAIKQAIEERLEELAMSAAEATKRLADIARSDISDFFHLENGVLMVDVEAITEHGHVIQQIDMDEDGAHKIKLYDAKDALKTILDAHGAFNHKQELEHSTPDQIRVHLDGEMPDISTPGEAGDGND